MLERIQTLEKENTALLEKARGQERALSRIEEIDRLAERKRRRKEVLAPALP